MSSTYSILCLSHDPAMYVEDYGSPNAARGEILTGVRGHPGCDLLIVRTSGAPVEFACPGHFQSEPGTRRPCYHQSALEWIDVSWLRILAYLKDDKSEELQKIRGNYAIRCWSPERVHRLRNILGAN